MRECEEVQTGGKLNFGVTSLEFKRVFQRLLLFAIVCLSVSVSTPNSEICAAGTKKTPPISEVSTYTPNYLSRSSSRAQATSITLTICVCLLRAQCTTDIETSHLLWLEVLRLSQSQFLSPCLWIVH